MEILIKKRFSNFSSKDGTYRQNIKGLQEEVSDRDDRKKDD